MKFSSSTIGIALLVSTTVVGCGKLPGVPGMGECKFSTGEISADLQGDAKGFIEAVMEARKLQMEWEAEMKAFAGALKVEGGEEAVIGKLKATFQNAVVNGKCTIDFGIDLDLAAQVSAAADGGGASGGADASGAVNVTLEPKCEAEGDFKAELDGTIEAIKVHVPKLMGIAKSQVMFLTKLPELVQKGQGLVATVATDFKILPEVKCAIEELTGFKANLDAKVDFSVSLKASASAEASAGG